MLLNKKIKKIILIVISIFIIIYLAYWRFIYWNFYLFKKENQINTWNRRVEGYEKRHKKEKTKNAINNCKIHYQYVVYKNDNDNMKIYLQNFLYLTNNGDDTIKIKTKDKIH